MIVLTHDYVVDVDKYCYTLMRDRHKQDKKGNPIRETLGYYRNLESTIIAAKEHSIKDIMCDDTVSLTEAIEIIKQANNEFRNLLKGALNDCND